MNWILALERKFGRYAIPGLTRIIVGFNALIFLLSQANPYFIDHLVIDPEKVLQGQIWRLFTFIFIPGTTSWFWIVFALLFLWWIGEMLEGAWGAFRLNLYYFIGMAATTAIAFFFGATVSNVTLNSSLFFAFARFFPDLTIYLFFILPVKVKWLAWFSAAMLLLAFLSGDTATRLSLLVLFGNYALFFGPDHFREFRHHSHTAARKARFQRESASDDNTLHRCETCGRTDASHPDLDFRIAKDGREYCTQHLPSTTPNTHNP